MTDRRGVKAIHFVLAALVRYARKSAKGSGILLISAGAALIPMTLLSGPIYSPPVWDYFKAVQFQAANGTVMTVNEAMEEGLLMPSADWIVNASGTYIPYCLKVPSRIDARLCASALSILIGVSLLGFHRVSVKSIHGLKVP